MSQSEKEFKGSVSAMRESPWLASEDLENPNGTGYVEFHVTIERVMEVKDAQFKGGRTKAKCYALQFTGKARMLVLNGVNRETLKEMFGRTAPEWLGKPIVLYVKPDVMLAGKKVPGIRIKAAPHKSKPVAESPKEQVADELPTEKEPVAELSEADQSYVKEVLAEIKTATEDGMKVIGAAVAKKSQPVKDAVRSAYAARMAELKAAKEQAS